MHFVAVMPIKKYDLESKNNVNVCVFRGLCGESMWTFLSLGTRVVFSSSSYIQRVLKSVMYSLLGLKYAVEAFPSRHFIMVTVKTN